LFSASTVLNQLVAGDPMLRSGIVGRAGFGACGNNELGSRIVPTIDGDLVSAGKSAVAAQLVGQPIGLV
jgi:hypothetical protein